MLHRTPAFWHFERGLQVKTMRQALLTGLQEHQLLGVKCLMLPYVIYECCMMHHLQYVSLRLRHEYTMDADFTQSVLFL